MKFKNIRWIWMAVILIAIILSGYLAVRLAFGSDIYVPEEFLQARIRGAEFADNIVKLSDESIKNLGLISDYDRSNNYAEGLALVREELTRNEAARDNALKLSRELIIMSNNLPAIKPASSSKPGLEAIIIGSQIAQYLISYNNDIYQLTELLRIKFINPAKGNNAKIRDIISEMNQEAQAVNNLNFKYKELMVKFDELTGLER